MTEFKVNTLIIGAGRSGTTSLFSYMEAHAEVCFSYIKEVHYFSIGDLYKKGVGYYHSFFKKCNDAHVIASADTYLLMDHNAISRIHAYNPEMKIIVMLRDPVARAYSSYNYSVNYGHHKPYGAFLDSIDVERDIENERNIVTRNNAGHFHGSLYHKHLSKWAEQFPREQLLLLETRELRESSQILSEKLAAFLNLSYFEGEIERVNATAVPKNRKLEKFLLDRDGFLRRMIRSLTPRFIKNLVMGSGLVDRLHDANRVEQAVTPLSKEEAEKAMLFFKDDLQLLKEEFNIEL
ncbi:MAG: sulfotransferase domain-containing protein [Bacteroidetes bacterium]|nr:sulfotransferase domain-containing protein [Bacteroidota bacterium]